MTDGVNSRIECNKHIAGDLRRRLEERYAVGMHVRKILDQLSDDELVDTFLQHDEQVRETSAKQRAEKESIA